MTSGIFMLSKLYLGTIVSPHGYEGKVNVRDIDTDIPGVKIGVKVLIGFSEKFSKEYTVEYWRQTSSKAVAKFKEIHSDKETQSLMEQGIFSDRDAVMFDETLPATHELVGATVFNIATGEQIGSVIEYWSLPANDVILVKTHTAQLPIPLIDDIVKRIDMSTMRIEVDLIDGLMDIAFGEE